MSDLIQLRRGTAAAWTSANPVLAQGELGIETDTRKFKVGDGTTVWASLLYLINTSGYLLTTDIGVMVQGYDANTAKLNVAQSFTKGQRGTIVPLTDGASITPDFSLANNYKVTLGGNRTLISPTNLVEGQSGVIKITQDGTGSRTLAYDWGWRFAGGTAPVLTTTAWGKDLFSYSVDVYHTATVTITIASPGVITDTAHGLLGNQAVQLTTTGALPTGYTASTTYFVVGSSITTNTYQLSATAGGAAINTTGSQSGTHTATAITITGAVIKDIK